MEYVGYVICIIIAYFTFRIGWGESLGKLYHDGKDIE